MRSTRNSTDTPARIFHAPFLPVRKRESKPIPEDRASADVVTKAAMCGARSLRNTGSTLYRILKTGVYPPHETTAPQMARAARVNRVLFRPPVNRPKIARMKKATPVNSLESLSPSLPK